MHKSIIFLRMANLTSETSLFSSSTTDDSPNTASLISIISKVTDYFITNSSDITENTINTTSQSDFTSNTTENTLSTTTQVCY